MTTPHSPGSTATPDASGAPRAGGPLRRRPRVLVASAVAVAALLAGGSYLAGAHASAERRAEVAARGARVMPFDLDRTTHVFDETPDGGRQTVTADVPGDAEQVRLVRQHLREERDAFARGDFTDPAAIHGRDMPGLGALQAGYQRFEVGYTDVPGGALLTYTSTDPVLVEALHAWFRAQISDHGGHAQGGHP